MIAFFVISVQRWFLKGLRAIWAPGDTSQCLEREFLPTVPSRVSDTAGIWRRVTASIPLLPPALAGTAVRGFLTALGRKAFNRL